MSISTPQDLWAVWGAAPTTSTPSAHPPGRSRIAWRAAPGHFARSWAARHTRITTASTAAAAGGWTVGGNVVMRSMTAGDLKPRRVGVGLQPQRHHRRRRHALRRRLDFSGATNVFSSTDGGASSESDPDTGNERAARHRGGGRQRVRGRHVGPGRHRGERRHHVNVVPSGTTQSLNAVWASASAGGELSAVGNTGIILHADSAGATLTQSPAATRETLNRVSGVAGGRSDRRRRDGPGPSIERSRRTPHAAHPRHFPLPLLYRALAGLGDEVYASGNGMILRSGDRGIAGRSIAWPATRSTPSTSTRTACSRSAATVTAGASSTSHPAAPGRRFGRLAGRLHGHLQHRHRDVDGRRPHPRRRRVASGGRCVLVGQRGQRRHADDESAAPRRPAWRRPIRTTRSGCRAIGAPPGSRRRPAGCPSAPRFRPRRRRPVSTTSAPVAGERSSWAAAAPS